MGWVSELAKLREMLNVTPATAGLLEGGSVNRTGYSANVGTRARHVTRNRGRFCEVALPVAPLKERKWRVKTRNKKPPGQVTERLC